jgi:hypothetical protein
MLRTAMVLVVCVAAGSSALACNDPAHLRQLKRQTEALEAQARSARQLERIERDRLRLEERVHRSRH